VFTLRLLAQSRPVYMIVPRLAPFLSARLHIFPVPFSELFRPTFLKACPLLEFAGFGPAGPGSCMLHATALHHVKITTPHRPHCSLFSVWLQSDCFYCVCSVPAVCGVRCPEPLYPLPLCPRCLFCTSIWAMRWTGLQNPRLADGCQR
jgi:hypothetical protein